MSSFKDNISSVQIKIYKKLDNKPRIKKMIKMRYFYLFLLPVLAYMFIFNYMPMYGVTLAFKRYLFLEGIWGSPWVGFIHFERLFASERFYTVLWNTLKISVYRLIFGFPAPIILALLLNEIKNAKFKKISQTISYLPYFLSWVVLGGIVAKILSPSTGAANYLLGLIGVEPIYFLASPRHFVGVLIITGIWQGVGWGTIVYLAAISGIDLQLYEAAVIDGASRLQKVLYITLPALLPIISILFILNLAGILSAGFDQIFNLYNPRVYQVADIIDTYVYRVGLIDQNYSFATAVGLFKNVIGLVLVLSANYITKKIGNYGLW